MRESKIEAFLVKYVRDLGGEVRKVQWIGRKDAPDRVVMLPVYGRSGRYSSCCTLWVELKATGEKPRPSQLREHARMRRMGQTVVVIDSFDGVYALLE